MQGDISLRIASPADAPALAEIYAPYVEQTAVSFEYDAPTPDEFARRIERTLEKYPYLVAERAGVPVGYAYAVAFHSRAAYGWAVETSIYVRRDERRSGVGRALYTVLERVLRWQGILNLNACVAWPEVEDEYLTYDSVRFHERMGFAKVGEFHSCGYKFGRWYGMVWLEKLIGAHEGVPEPVTPFAQLRAQLNDTDL